MVIAAALSGQAATRPLRLAMVVTGFPSEDRLDSGIFNARAAKSLCEELDVRVIHLRAWKPGREVLGHSVVDGIPVASVAVPQIPWYSAVNIRLFRSLGWPLVRETLAGCDLVQSVGADFAGLVASSWAIRAGIHHVVQLTGGDVNSLLHQARGFGCIKGWEEGVHAVASNSRALLEEFRKLYPKMPNLRTVYRGVDLRRFNPEGPTGGPLAGSGPVRFLFLGGFPKYPTMPDGANTKGGETLLSVWKENESELNRAGASLIIAGPESCSNQVSMWRSGLQNPNRVHVVGVLDPVSIPDYLRACDAVLIPSTSEGLPNVAMEAAACGKPVLGSAVGGIPEVVTADETGFLLPAADVGAWAKAITEASRNPERLRLMGLRARGRMEAGFDSILYRHGMVDLFRAALRESLTPGQTGVSH